MVSIMNMAGGIMASGKEVISTTEQLLNIRENCMGITKINVHATIK